MSDEIEVMDLVDINNKVIGKFIRDDSKPIVGGYLRAVGVFLINSDNKLWIPIRSTSKKIAPGGYDFSAGEHVQAGESFEQAAIRGLAEELNIDAHPENLQELGLLHPTETLHYFNNIYIYPYDVSPDYDKTDYTSYEWLSPKELRKKLSDGVICKEALLQASNLLSNLE
jgi:isopentenyldiphosphate isomerase